MAIRRLVILKHVGKTPSFAECEQCHLKFFTPREMEYDPLGAEEHLRVKFETHTCKFVGNVGPGHTKSLTVA